jgi:hypothetical protein
VYILQVYRETPDGWQWQSVGQYETRAKARQIASDYQRRGVRARVVADRD